MNDQPQWIVTASARDGDKPFAGSVIRWCAICSCDVWLSPVAIQRMDYDHNLKPLCLECAVPFMAQHDQVIGSAIDPTAPESPQILRLMKRLINDYRKGNN